MQSCSKAPWGLLVLAWSDGIFTANARSPWPSPRQCPHDYSIRAGLNLPDKEFRYLRTIIVIAAVHRGFSSNRKALPLTFRHRAGVSPYTSAFALAETYVFGKQFRGLFSCGPLIKMTIRLLEKTRICKKQILICVLSQRKNSVKGKSFDYIFFDTLKGARPCLWSQKM